MLERLTVNLLLVAGVLAMCWGPAIYLAEVLRG